MTSPLQADQQKMGGSPCDVARPARCGGPRALVFDYWSGSWLLERRALPGAPDSPTICPKLWRQAKDPTMSRLSETASQPQRPPNARAWLGRSPLCGTCRCPTRSPPARADACIVKDDS